MLVHQIESILCQSVPPCRLLLSISFTDLHLPVRATIDNVLVTKDTASAVHVEYYEGQRLHQFAHLLLLADRYPPLQSGAGLYDWVATCDDDDICHSRRLERIAAVVRAHETEAPLDVVFCARLIGVLDCDVAIDGIASADAAFALPGKVCRYGDHGSMHVRESLLRAYLTQLRSISSVTDCDMRAWLARRSIESNRQTTQYSDDVLYYQRRWTAEPGHWTDGDQLQIAERVLRGDYVMVDR